MSSHLIKDWYAESTVSLLEDLVGFIKRNSHKRLVCFTGAVFVAFIQPLSLAAAAQSPPQTINPLIVPVSYSKPISAPVMPEVAQIPLPVPATPPAPVCASGVTTANYALNQLIQHESGGRSCVENPGGCFGLLQACPGAPLKIACGGDVACQLDWFTRNKLPTYGTWESAWAKWQSRCGSALGCWW